MAGAATDKFRKSYAFTSKTLSSSIDNSTGTIPLNNVTNIPTDTGVTIIIDRVDANGNATPSLREICTGVVSGTSIISATRGQQGTTAQTHALGAVVELQVSAQVQNDMVDGILVSHNQDGTMISNLPLTTPKITTGLKDANGNTMVGYTATGSAVNNFSMVNAASGSHPKLTVAGSGTNINLNLQGKGTGNVTINGSPILSGMNYVVSGCVWTGDALGSTKAASMTSGVVMINGNYLTVAAVVARTFTASKDTYVDFQDNGDGTALIAYSEATNNAASSALANSGTTANTLRNAIIVTGASSIAAAGSINQGEKNKVLPIASSIAYAVTDSLGNLICNRNPSPGVIGYRQIVADVNISTTGSQQQITGISVPCIIPTGRRIKVSAFSRVPNNGSNSASQFDIWDGVVSSGTVLTEGQYNTGSSQVPMPLNIFGYDTPSAGLHTYNLSVQIAAGTLNIQSTSTAPTFLVVELA